MMVKVYGLTKKEIEKLDRFSQSLTRKLKKPITRSKYVLHTLRETVLKERP